MFAYFFGSLVLDGGEHLPALFDQPDGHWTDVASQDKLLHGLLISHALQNCQIHVSPN